MNGSVCFHDNSHHVIARKERSERRGNPLYAIGTNVVCGTIPSSQWIATGFALAITKQLMFANLLCIAN